MSKPFFRYEDTPLVLAAQGSEGSMIFAHSATLSVTQPIEAKYFADDHLISFAKQTGDIVFDGVQESGFLMGPVSGPGVPLPESVEVVSAGTKISYPGGQGLYVAEDVYPGDYYIKVKSTGNTTLRYNEDIGQGEIEVKRNYASSSAVHGNLAVSYYMDSGNLPSFFDITGLINPDCYPQVNEARVSGALGDYVFDNAYIKDLGFSAQPFQPIQANVNLAIYGNLKYVSGNSEILMEKIIEDINCTRGVHDTVPHAIGTSVEGASDVGVNYTLGFSYAIAATRNPTFHIPLSGTGSAGGEVPVRMNKEAISITAQIQGEKLDPYLKISGKRADLNIKLADIGFDKSFTDNNIGLLNEFKVYGVIDSNNLNVSAGGFLQGTATVKQAYR